MAPDQNAGMDPVDRNLFEGGRLMHFPKDEPA
jgi:hypothetical protein